MTDTDATLSERGKRYGKFSGHAMITQLLKACMQGDFRIAGAIIAKLCEDDTPENMRDKWQEMTPSQRESLEMIAHKIGRILNGDPDYDDSWRDIAGYAELIVKQLNGEDI